MPYSDVLAAFVLDGVDLQVTDFGTSVTSPEDYLSNVVEFALFDVGSGEPRPIDDDGIDALAAAAKAAQRQLYRTIAGMERRAKIDAGRVRVLHVPAAVRRARGRRARLDRAA